MTATATVPNSTKTVNKGGRPRNVNYEAIATDDSISYEKTKQRWNHLALYLADQALKVAQGDKKNIAQIVTSAAIAFDKAHGKKENDTVTISIPASLQSSLMIALKPAPSKTLSASDNNAYVTLDGSGPGSVPETDSQLRMNQSQDQDLEQVKGLPPATGG